MKAKRITKKEIQNTLRTLDTTKIFHLYSRIIGHRVEEADRSNLHYFIEEYAPTKRIYRKAHMIARTYGNFRPIRSRDMVKEMVTFGDKHHIISYFKEQMIHPKSPYAKIPMYGHTHLYFCSPDYGHFDYNKWRACKIKGNERFCETLIKIAAKIWKYEDK